LRDRIEDIAHSHITTLESSIQKLNKNVRGFTTDAEKILKKYHWPGNVRELKNIIERVMILQSLGTLITSDNIPSEIRVAAPHAPGLRTGEPSSPDLLCQADYRSTIDELTNKIKQEILGKALEASRGNKAAAARHLGISRYTLIRELRKMENNNPSGTPT